jgi:hypothetical protein
MSTNRKSYSKSITHILSGSIITLATIASIAYFMVQLAGIKKDTPSVVFGIDFITYYTAALLIQSEDSPEIYAKITDDFSVVKNGKFYETARNAGFPLTPPRYLYLPIFLVFFIPFTALSYPTAVTLWLIINLGALIAVIMLQWSLTSGLPHPWLRLMSITSLNLGSFPLLYALKLGQTSIMVYLIVCLTFYSTLKGKDYLAGISLGLITALKYAPLLFIIYFLYRRRYALAISSAVTVISLFLLSILIYGLHLHEIYWNYLRDLTGIGIAAWSNQSIEAFVLRLATKASIFHFFPVKATSLIYALRYFFTFSVMGIVYLFLKRCEGRKDTIGYPLEFSALVLCLLIIPSISWLHYFIMATLAIILIISHCWQNYPSQLKVVGPLTAFCYLMISFHPNYAYLTTSFGQGYYTRTVVSLPFLGACALLLINLLLMKKIKAPS